MTQCKSVVSPGVVGQENRGTQDDAAGFPKDPRMYRNVVAKLNYLAQDRPDMVFAVHRLTMRMSDPSAEDWGPVKRVLRTGPTSYGASISMAIRHWKGDSFYGQ